MARRLESLGYFTVLLVLLTAATVACSAASDGDTPRAAASGSGGETPASGLVIEQLVVGDGASPKPTDVVRVHYHGTFAGGEVFDSSVERGEPARFPLNRVIPCWTEGLQLMKVGGKARLTCPPGIAYGAAGAPPTIPPNATLTFEVELLGIN